MSRVLNTRMANLGAGLQADGLPAVQAEQPEDSPRWVLPANEQSSGSLQGQLKRRHSMWE